MNSSHFYIHHMRCGYYITRYITKIRHCKCQYFSSSYLNIWFPCFTVSLSIHNIYTIILMLRQKSFHTRVLTFSTFSQVSLLLDDQVIHHLPPLLFLLGTVYVIRKPVPSIECFLYTSHKYWYVSVEVFLFHFY
jgi:hypothetical protein